MELYDDDLQRFEAAGVALPVAAEVRVPVTIVHSEHDEFIKREHAEYLARSIPGARLVLLAGVSHFAPLQRPNQFNEALLGFLANFRPR